MGVVSPPPLLNSKTKLAEPATALARAPHLLFRILITSRGARADIAKTLLVAIPADGSWMAPGWFRDGSEQAVNTKTLCWIAKRMVPGRFQDGSDLQPLQKHVVCLALVIIRRWFCDGSERPRSQTSGSGVASCRPSVESDLRTPENHLVCKPCVNIGATAQLLGANQMSL